MVNWFRLTVLAFAVLIAGCGGGVKEEVSQVIKITPTDLISTVVKGIADTGAELGSGEESLREAIEELRSEDEAKATAVTAELDKLVKAKNPTSRKAAAKAMLAKL